MTNNIKCPHCGFEGQMNRFIHTEPSKDKESESRNKIYVSIIITEHYCPKCKNWFKE